MMARPAALIIAFLLQGAAAAATPAVTWITPEQANDTNNSSDHYLSFLMGRLPGFDHRVQRGAAARAWHELQANRTAACVFNALKTPAREAIAIFSRRPMLAPAYRLYFPVGRGDALAPYLDADGRVDLGRLAAAALKGGITADRAYDPAIDAFIAARRKGRPLNAVASTRQLLNLLRSGRFDFAFAAPIDFNEAEEERSSAPITRAEPWNATFVACSKNKSGQAVIAAIDRIFEDQENWAEFTEPLRAALSPEDYAVTLRSAP